MIGAAEALVARLPAPEGDAASELKALLVDSWYDPYLGVMALVRVKDGTMRKGLKIRMMSTGATHEIERVGVFHPKETIVDELGPGEITFRKSNGSFLSKYMVADLLPLAFPLLLLP